MKKVGIVSIVAVLFGFASYAAQGIYGSWKMGTVKQGPVSFEVSISFAKDTVSIKNVCTIGPQSAEAQVTVPATITDHNVVISTGKEDRQSKNGVDCNVSIAPSIMNYSVSADDATLTLSVPGQGQMTLPRQ